MLVVVPVVETTSGDVLDPEDDVELVDVDFDCALACWFASGP